MKRMKKGFKKLLSLCMVIETVFSSIPMVHAEELEKTISSPVLITEIVPNTDNMNKLDAYEYYELMNISDQDVNLSDYNIVYVNDTKTSIWKTNVQVLPAGEKMLVWTRNEGNTELTKADFIAYYGLAEDAFIAEVKCDGLANSKRGLAITDSNGNVLLSTTYNSEDSQNGTIDINEAIVFTYNGNDITLKYDQLPSPLHVEEECIVGEYVAPKQDENEDQPTINPDESQDENIDQSKAPVLLISEIIPDTTNVNGSDGYEYIEIYNNADTKINLKDYQLCYNYPDTGVIAKWWETDSDFYLESGETLVFWVLNGANNDLTKADFNQFYGTSLSDEQIITVESGGLANGSYRGVSIYTNVGDVVDAVYYNQDADQTEKNLSITYQSQFDNGFKSVMTDNMAFPTPGFITENETAQYTAKVIVPTSVPRIVDRSDAEFSNDTPALNYKVEVESDETTIKTVKLYKKYIGEEQFECVKLQTIEANIFSKSINNIDLLNKKGFTYYFEASDGWNTVRTEEKTILNTDASNSTSFNVKEGTVLTDTQQIITYGNQLFIDGVDVTSNSIPSINGYGKLAFEATDTDVFFKNAVAVGEHVIGVFNEGTYSNVVDYVYDIDASMFDLDTMTITVEFHAGNKANPLEHNIENNDDFVIRNIRLVLPNGRTLTPESYQAKKGLGAVEHANMDDVEKMDLNIPTQSTNISMGDGTSKYEIVYANFKLGTSDFEAIRYMWDTTQAADGTHSLANETTTISLLVDNTAPKITTNIEDQAVYKKETIRVNATDELSSEVDTTVTLDGKMIEVPYEFRALDMKPGEHELAIVAKDNVGNQATKKINFITKKESADIIGDPSPANGTNVTTSPVLSVVAKDESNDDMVVTFKDGARYQLGDSNITSSKGISSQNGSMKDVFTTASGNGFPYECFDVALGDDVTSDSVINVKWTGIANNQKTYLYVYNTKTDEWDQLTSQQNIHDDEMTLTAEVCVENHLVDQSLKILVQNGEGYTPPQYVSQPTNVMRMRTNVLDGTTPTYNVDDTPREEYDFTFAVESDTQYYNEDYDGNKDQNVDGKYQHQLNIHNWLLANRQRMNIQYLFHNGDIIDDEDNIREWEQADAAYQLLDNASLPYGILAGNHDVGHLSGTYDNYTTYFGEERYVSNPWYGGSYQSNKGHYDLITVGGIDFIMIYMGWGIGDDEINWMNDVLAKYPERKAILNFHEFLLASGGLGEEPQRVYDEVIAVNENVCMVLSGHYHNAKTRVDTFTNKDGSTRKVHSMLFDYQGLTEGGSGYFRLMHFDLEGQRMIVRTYTPSYGGIELSNYGDYDAKKSDVVNEGNAFVIDGASINDPEHFTISFAELGITPRNKTLETTNLDVNVYNQSVIGTLNSVKSGEEASYVWDAAENGKHGWYAEVTDEHGGLTRTNVSYVNVEKQTVPELTAPTQVKNVSVKQDSYKAVTLTWDVVEGATSYDVYKKGYKENSVFGLETNVETNSVKISGLMTGKTYTFYVVAKNEAGVSENSATVSITTKLSGEITLDIKQVSTSKFKLSWNPIDGATRYIIYRKRNNDSYQKVITLGAQKLEYVTAELPNGNYSFIVKAGRYDSTNLVISESSNAVKGAVEAVKPVVTLKVGTKQVKVIWEKMEGVTHYEVYRATTGKYTKLKTTSAVSYTAKSLTKGKKYYFKVRGYKTYKSGDNISYKVYTPYSSAKAIVGK